MSVFGKNYSRYYDLLYKEKDYKGEVEYVNKLIERYSKNKPETLLDIGCGTGKHLKCFKDLGYIVYGIDLSRQMINKAKTNLSRDAKLFCCNSTDFNFDIKFDVIVSLFHVINYITCNRDLEKTFENIYLHLKKDGIFICDFWYGPAVLKDPPIIKIKRLEDNNIKVARISEPIIHANSNIVDVNFEIFITDKKTSTLEIIKETHKMRYLFLPEMQLFLDKANLKIVDSFQWFSLKEKLSLSSWYGVLIIGKK